MLKALIYSGPNSILLEVFCSIHLLYWSKPATSYSAYFRELNVLCLFFFFLFNKWKVSLYSCYSLGMIIVNSQQTIILGVITSISCICQNKIIIQELCYYVFSIEKIVNFLYFHNPFHDNAGHHTENMDSLKKLTFSDSHH